MSHFSPSQRRKGKERQLSLPQATAEDSMEVESESQERPKVEDDITRPIGLENKKSIPFGYLVNLFTKVEGKQTKYGSKSEALAGFITKWRRDVGPDLYPLVRLLTPERDTRRRTYQLKEQKLAKALVAALQLPPGSSDANALISWKTPTVRGNGAGEFSSVAYEVIKLRSIYLLDLGEKSIDDVNNVLDQLANAKDNVGVNGVKRTLSDEHARIMKECFETMTPTEIKWLIRIILKDLKISMGEKTIFNAIHEDAMSLFNTCSDILRVCWRLYDVKYRLPREDNQVTINSAFRPMLSSRNKRHIANIVTKMKDGRDKVQPFTGSEEDREFYYAKDEFMIEEKIDGERLQLHKDGNNYQWYSRKAKDYTYLYGSTPKEGSVTPYIHHLFHDKIEQVILDGEMLAYDPILGKCVAFGTLKTFAKKTSFGEDETRPVFKVFDVLSFKTYDGPTVSLIGSPLRLRKKALASIINPAIGVLEVVEVFRANCADDISRRLKVILAEFGEGLVIKHPESLYILGGREPTWVKVKPDYMDELGETIDAVVVGGFYGTGHRGGRHSSFLVALRDTEAKPVNGVPLFRTFAKVGTGIDAAGYAWIIEHTAGKWRDVVPNKKTNKPSLPGWFQTVSEVPDQIIQPQEIKAAEIIDGDDYGAAMTLRFPRACGIRVDIDCLEAFTMNDVLTLRGAGNKRSFGSALDGKHKKVKAVEFQAHSLNVPLGSVDTVSNIFEGLVFYVHHVIPDTPSAKTALRVQIKANGGQFKSKMPENNSARRIIDGKFVGLSEFKNSDTFDVLLPRWVQDCCTARKLLPRTKEYYVKVTEATSKTPEYNQPTPIVIPFQDQEMEEDGDGDEEEEEENPVASGPGTSNSPNKIVRKKEYNMDEDMDETYYERGGDSDNEGKLNHFGEARERNIDSDEESEQETEDEYPSDIEIIEPVASTSTSTHTLTSTSNSNLIKKGGNIVNSPVPQIKRLIIAPPEEKKYSLDDSDDEELIEMEDAVAPPGMGAGSSLISFNPDSLFDQYVCYFDTRENAVRNTLVESNASEKTQLSADDKLNDARETLIRNGGIATDNLLDPKLTHIIVIRRVPDRIQQMIESTSSPRRRRVATYDWIIDSELGHRLMEVQDYAPF